MSLQNSLSATRPVHPIVTTQLHLRHSHSSTSNCLYKTHSQTLALYIQLSHHNSLSATRPDLYQNVAPHFLTATRSVHLTISQKFLLSHTTAMHSFPTQSLAVYIQLKFRNSLSATRHVHQTVAPQFLLSTRPAVHRSVN